LAQSSSYPDLFPRFPGGVIMAQTLTAITGAALTAEDDMQHLPHRDQQSTGRFHSTIEHLLGEARGRVACAQPTAVLLIDPVHWLIVGFAMEGTSPRSLRPRSIP
jgi:hypothetical protein